MRNIINDGQIRAARALLDWSQEKLAEESGLSIATIRKIESGQISPRDSTMEAIAHAMRTAKIEFVPPMGVNLKANDISLIEGDNSYGDLLDNIHQTLKDKGGEVLFMYADNALTSAEQVEQQIKMRKCGIRFRFLCEEGNTFLRYPLAEYRWIPKKYFNNNLQIIYGDKVAVCIYQGMAFGKVNKAVVVDSMAFAESAHDTFEFVWDNCRAPSHSTAQEVF